MRVLAVFEKLKQKIKKPEGHQSLLFRGGGDKRLSPFHLLFFFLLPRAPVVPAQRQHHRSSPGGVGRGEEQKAEARSLLRSSSSGSSGSARSSWAAAAVEAKERQEDERSSQGDPTDHGRLVEAALSSARGGPGVVDPEGDREDPQDADEPRRGSRDGSTESGGFPEERRADGERRGYRREAGDNDISRRELGGCPRGGEGGEGRGRLLQRCRCCFVSACSGRDGRGGSDKDVRR